MTDKHLTTESALEILSNPCHSDWFEAFAFLSAQPETAQLMIDAFSTTLTEMGIEPTGIDKTTGKSAYSSADIASAMGINVSELDASMSGSGKSVN